MNEKSFAQRFEDAVWANAPENTSAVSILLALKRIGHWEQDTIVVNTHDNKIARIARTSVRTVRNWLKKLHQLGWFDVDIVGSGYVYHMRIPSEVDAAHVRVADEVDHRLSRYVENDSTSPALAQIEDVESVSTTMENPATVVESVSTIVETDSNIKPCSTLSLHHSTSNTTTTAHTRETSGGGQSTPGEVKGLDPKPTPEQAPASSDQAVYGEVISTPQDSPAPKANPQEQIRPGDRMQLGQLIEPKPDEPIEAAVAKLFAWHEIPIDAKALRVLVTVLLTSCPNDPGALLRGVMADLSAAQSAPLKHEHKRSSWACARMKATAKRYIELYGTPPEGEKRKPKKIRGLMGREMIGTETGRQEIGRF